MTAGQSTVADDRVGGDADESGGGPHAAAVIEVLQQREGLVRTQLRAEEGRAFAFGEPIPAGAAVQEPDVLVLAVVGADGQVAEATPAVIRTARVQATEVGEVLVHDSTSLTRMKREWNRKAIGNQLLTDFNGLETPPCRDRREVSNSPPVLLLGPPPDAMRSHCCRSSTRFWGMLARFLTGDDGHVTDLHSRRGADD